MRKQGQTIDIFDDIFERYPDLSVGRTGNSDDKLCIMNDSFHIHVEKTKFGWKVY